MAQKSRRTGILAAHRQAADKAALGAAASTMLRIFDQAPPDLWNHGSHELADLLGGPALIRLRGRQAQPLFVATLLHGNESTGWNALCDLMRGNGKRELPRAMTLFIGNVHAAREGLRQLDGQPDFNRIWHGHQGPESALAAQVIAEVTREHPIACLDLHNTSGENPVYGCVHRLDDRSAALAGHFAKTLVLVRHPESLLSMALSALAPAATIECGKPGNPAITRQISERLRALLEDTGVAVPRDTPHTLTPDMQVMRSVARVRIPEHLSFTMSGADADLSLVADLERHNFERIPDGTVIARMRAGSNAHLEAFDDNGVDVADRYFRREGDTLVAAGSIVPSMFTPNERIVRQDCLCYLMESIESIDGG